MRKRFHDLTSEEKSVVCNDWLQCEGCDDRGNEYDSPAAWHNARNFDDSADTSYRHVQVGDDYIHGMDQWLKSKEEQ